MPKKLEFKGQPSVASVLKEVSKRFNLKGKAKPKTIKKDKTILNDQALAAIPSGSELLAE